VAGRRWRVTMLATAAALVAAACTAPEPPPAPGSSAPAPPLGDTPWPMHLIAGSWRGANSLAPGDVDADGDVDYLTNYEFDQRYVLSLNPGPGPAQSLPWPQVQLFPPGGGAPPQGQGVNAEHTWLTDVDGDGNLDAVVAQGGSLLEFWEGSSPGVRVFFGPGPDRATDPFAWVDAGRFPITTTFGQFHFVRAKDLDGDGVEDIVAGGRRSDLFGTYAGIVWFEAPDDPARRRDLGAYTLHRLAPGHLSGHGFVWSDVDDDGDDDLVDANGDFDTPESEEALMWYENPGATSTALRAPWSLHEIWRSPTFHTKPQVAVGDLDGDGLEDLVTMTEHSTQVFRKTSTDPVAFERIGVPKHPATDWLTRPVRMADVDGDGRQDLVGMLTHRGGTIPRDRAAVFWMSYTGDRPGASNWTTHVIRWGSGLTALIPEFGEKWDQVDVRDVDGDGDPDLVANCEEWWSLIGLEVAPYFQPQPTPSTVAVVWFENTVGEAERVHLPVDGRYEIEAEAATAVLDGTWAERSEVPGASGGSFLRAHTSVAPALEAELPVADRLADVVGSASTAGVRYHLGPGAAGTYAVWIRHLVPGRWGYGLGGSKSDGVWVDLDGDVPQVVGESGGPTDVWRWSRAPRPVTVGPDGGVLTLRQRDRGAAVDRIVVSADPAWVPR